MKLLTWMVIWRTVSYFIEPVLREILMEHDEVFVMTRIHKNELTDTGFKPTNKVWVSIQLGFKDKRDGWLVVWFLNVLVNY